MKVDFKKTLAAYKAKKNVLSIVDVPPLSYLMIDGHGAPAEAGHLEAIQALYPLAYTLKFMSKIDLEKDYVVPPLEGLWWAEDMESFTTKRDKSKWDWTMMILTPEWITVEMFAAAKEKVIAKKSPPKKLDDVRLAVLEEGTCVQTLHIGSYDDEGPILEKMHNEFIPENGLEMTAKHHEIYFSDFRKVAPEKLKTLLRQPVQKV